MKDLDFDIKEDSSKVNTQIIKETIEETQSDITELQNKTGDAGYMAGKGSWVYSEINGVKTKVYTKYFIGTTAVAGTTEFAHGISDIDKILHISAIVRYVTNQWWVYDYAYGDTPNNHWRVSSVGANIRLYHGSNVQGKIYRCKIDYYE